MVAKSKICTVAPLAYQKGPETPYRYAMPELCKSVAAHVHEETTAEATNPDFTVRPAVLNISDVWSSLLYLLRTQVTRICIHLVIHLYFGMRGLTYHAKGKYSTKTKDNAIAPADAERRSNRHFQVYGFIREKTVQLLRSTTCDLQY